MAIPKGVLEDPLHSKPTPPYLYSVTAIQFPFNSQDQSPQPIRNSCPCVLIQRYKETKVASSSLFFPPQEILLGLYNGLYYCVTSSLHYCLSIPEHTSSCSPLVVQFLSITYVPLYPFCPAPNLLPLQ